jgi:hypothetical protein
LTAEETPRKKITVYVRAPQDEHGEWSEDSRTLSFQRIPEISNREAVEERMAIDGNSFLISVTPLDVLRVFNQEEDLSLAKALRLWQESLMKFLETKGYEVEFD